MNSTSSETKELSLKFTVPGNPQGQARPRFTSYGPKRAYKPSKNSEQEERIQVLFKHQLTLNRCSIPKAYKGVAVFLDVFYPVPKSWSKDRISQAVARKVLPKVKPDVDNVLKAFLDALNGFAYKDDKEVVAVAVSKYYAIDTKPRVDVVVSWLALGEN